MLFSMCHYALFQNATANNVEVFRDTFDWYYAIPDSVSKLILKGNIEVKLFPE